MNTFGRIFRLTTFGESHGKAIGGVIDGCPPGLVMDYDFIRKELQRRRPGQSHLTTPRSERDEVEFLSGIFEGKTTGTPIGFMIKNDDQISKDYDHLRDIFRPSHADFTYFQKYGIRDHSGGGRSSARVTSARVVAGAVAKLFLKQVGIEIFAYTSQVGKIKLQKSYKELDLSKVESNPVRCPDEETAAQMIQLIEQIKEEGDTIGGIITCVIKNVPVGLGEPEFGKINAELAYSMLSINAVKGFDIGSGFDSPGMKGSEHNDSFYFDANDNKVHTRTNNSGGVQGGLSNGEDIYFRVVFKPVATIMKEQITLDKNNEAVTFKAHGRHDPCVLPRAVSIVESMAAITLIDLYLQNQAG